MHWQSYLDNILASIVYDGEWQEWPSLCLVWKENESVNTNECVGVNVTGAYGWAIFDNFECKLHSFMQCNLGHMADEENTGGSGLNTRFGLQYVNYTSLERTPKASMFTFLNWFKQHGREGLAAGSANYSMSGAL